MGSWMIPTGAVLYHTETAIAEPTDDDAPSDDLKKSVRVEELPLAMLPVEEISADPAGNFEVLVTLSRFDCEGPLGPTTASVPLSSPGQPLNETMLISGSTAIVAVMFVDGNGQFGFGAGIVSNITLECIGGGDAAPHKGCAFRLKERTATAQEALFAAESAATRIAAHSASWLTEPIQLTPGTYGHCWATCMAAEDQTNWNEYVACCRGFLALQPGQWETLLSSCALGCVPLALVGGVGYLACLFACLESLVGAEVIACAACLTEYGLKHLGSAAGCAWECAW